MLVRPVFREFFEREDVFNCGNLRPDCGDQTGTLVLGIPGIGKSSFALYCLWRLVTQEKCTGVVYEYPKGLGKSRRDVAVFGTADKHAVYIADGVEPGVALKRSLLVSSPRQKVFEEYKKNAVSFFMPEPTSAELALLRHV